MDKTKIMTVFMLFVVAILATSVVSAYSGEDAINDGTVTDLQVLQIKIDGNEVENGDTIRTEVERGDSLEVKVQLFTENDTEDVEVEVFLKGDDHHTISETSDVFDLDANVIKWETFDITLPENMEQDDYDLRVMVAPRYGAVKVYNYNLQVSTQKHGLEIRDVVLSPQYGVKAGQGLFATVRMKNVGQKDEEGIKVTVSVPALGMSYSDYIDELEAEDQITSEELWLGRVPECATPGMYTVDVEVLYDEYTRSVSTTDTIEVFEGNLCAAEAEDVEETETINVPASAQDMEAGVGGAVYVMVINNPSNTAKAYTITVSGVEGWGTTRVDPSNTIIVDGKDSVAVSLYVSANEDAAAGERTFVANVASASGSADVVMTANVLAEEAEEAMGLVQGLQVALLVLVVLLVILGLILVFNRMKGKDDGMDEQTQSYY